MMNSKINSELLEVSLRQRAFYIPGDASRLEVTAATLYTSKQLQGLGYAMSEPLLHAVNALTPTAQAEIVKTVNDVLGCDLNWAPLVKGWDTPTGEKRSDHLITELANIYGEEAGFTGTRLPCGHLIPDGTFPLERYNGCPFCGTPFELARSDYRGQGSKLRMLELWRDADVDRHFRDLLQSPVPLDGTQRESLAILLKHLPLPNDVTIGMKETRMLVIHVLIATGRDDEAQAFMSTPADVMRFLWHEHTGSLQLLRPAALVHAKWRLGVHHTPDCDESVPMALKSIAELRLHYDRSWCRRVAKWLNEMPMSVAAMCENMHPRRGMWVRFIRALRLPEMARRKGYDHLRDLLDTFYRQDYPVWQGKVDRAKVAMDCDATLALLQQRPGVFARALFATMLWFGPDKPLAAFEKVLPKLPLRLAYTLGSVAETYFDPQAPKRTVRVATGATKVIDNPGLLKLYSAAQLEDMQERVVQLYRRAIEQHFAATTAPAGATIYIDPQLYQIPVAVGDRSSTIHDLTCALQGTRFAIEGNAVRLFMQWGKGLPAQNFDMDLSCAIAYDNKVDVCSYYQLTPTGAKHSGDIRRIPDKVGTAEYIELDIDTLRDAGARYVVFTCNAYSAGALVPNLVVGWMNSEYPMTVSDETGVAYDPSTVQHQVRVPEDNLSKGLVFGALDVAKREIIWLEMPFTSQNVQGLDMNAVKSILNRLEHKIKIGDMLAMKAQVQGLTPVDTPEGATEVYTYQWALDAAAVARLLLSSQSIN